MVDQTDFQIERYEEGGSLDLFSTSPTLFRTCAALRCAFHAPFFAYCEGGHRYHVVQGCCNHWECPRCGQMVAAQHYGRIVQGAREIAETSQLWFITVTCRGKDVSVEEATDNYLAWTSKLLDACYTRAHRVTKKHPKKDAWHYVQVTEKQKRGHPHSHILSTFAPHDLVMGTKENWKRDHTGNLVREEIPCLRSAWFQSQVIRAGLGDQYDISAVKTVEGASRYVAKYMFKDSQFKAHYPEGWKRVRYGDWPKLPEVKTDAFVLLSREDWDKLANVAAIITAENGSAFEEADFQLHNQIRVIETFRKGSKNERNNNQ